MIKRGRKNSISSVGLPILNTLGGWCGVFNQFTENLMIGMLTKPTIVKTEVPRAARTGSLITRLMASIPRYIMNSTNIDVRRASHAHQVPHIGLPQIAPVISETKAKAAPKGAAERTAMSARG